MERSELLDTINKMDTIINKLSIQGEIVGKLNDVRRDMENFRHRIPAVGRFSAGKSALLNTLLEIESLKEGQEPETAIATELVYNEKEKAVLVNEAGVAIECSIAEANSKNPEEYQYYTYCLANPFLKEHQEIVLVDMPGFDSGMERHNKAILRYIDKASAYLLVIDAGDGAISTPTINFIREINKYGSDVMIAVTKCDIKSEQENKVIVAHIEETASKVFGRKVPVIATDIFDKELPKKFIDMLAKIDLEKSFANRYESVIRSLKLELLTIVKTMQENLSYNPYELDKKIHELEQARDAMLAQVDTESKKLHNKLFSTVFNQVSSDVRGALLGSVNRVVNAAMVSQEAFATAINDIIRPVVIVSIHKNVELCLENFINEIDFKSVNIVVDVEEVGNNLREMYQHVIDTVGKKYKNINVGNKEDKKNSGPSGKTIAQGVLAALALATDIVAPEIELLIVLLPQMMPALEKFLKKFQIESFKNKMREEVIPEIMLQFNNNLKETLAKIEEEKLVEIKQHINDLIACKEEAIQNLKHESAEGRKRYQLKLQELESVIGDLS